MLTAGGALDSANNLKTNQYRFPPQPAQLETPFQGTTQARLPRGKEAGPYSWSHYARIHCTKTGVQGLEAGACPESDRPVLRQPLAPIPNAGKHAHRSMAHLTSEPLYSHSFNKLSMSVRGFYRVSDRTARGFCAAAGTSG